MKIYFLQFHAKINRIVKRYADLEGYSDFLIEDIGYKDATNFPYNDGISTVEVYNFTSNKMPDYAIIVDDYEVVRSRWYVEETKYTRNGQWRCSFRRDVLADFMEEVINATSLIEKATVSNNDPAIYIQEPITFNMIKKAETLIKDSTGSAWLVGYLSSDNASEKAYTATTSNEIKLRVNGIATWDLYKYLTEDFIGAPHDQTYNIKIGNQAASWKMMQYSFNKWGRAITDTQIPLMGYARLKEGDYAYNRLNVTNPAAYTVISPNWYGEGSYYDMYAIAAELSQFLSISADVFDGIFLSQTGEFHTEAEEGALKVLNNTMIFDSSTSKTYVISVIKTGDLVEERYTPSKESTLYNSIITSISQRAERVYVRGQSHENEDDVYVKYSANTYRISLQEVTTESANLTITSTRNLLNDAPYTMFAIPYNVCKFKYGADTYNSDESASISIARQISMELMSSGALYDLQLLPYCPRIDLIDGDAIDLRSAIATEHADYEFIKDQDNAVKSFVLFAKESNFTFDVNFPIEITEKKVQNQCDSWRLCSPNYNGVFEFNAAKNNGVDYFNVDCTYRPYTPYIHINPNFKELYGNDYDDARGLICSGDFSLPASTEKWLEYEAQNKNYQNSFDRSIQHMEIEQKYQRINQISSAVAGIGTGAVGGGMIGGVGGAIAGGALSAAGGIADIVMGEKLRSENIRYAKDQFAFNLENIKAIPNSLAKVSAFTKNNKIFPFLEFYTCTDIERQAFRDVILYDGMTVNRIGRIIDFLGEGITYVKARLIRAIDLHDDAHIVDYIASEMEKGAYYDTGSN